MNQERFDDLTRALATNRLSRWQVLKAFGAVASLAFLETLSPLRTASAVAASSCSDENCEPDPDPDNNVCGSCAEMVDYYQHTGVKDARKKYHRGYVGWTTPEWKVEYPPGTLVGPYKKKGKWCYKSRYKFKASVKSEVRTLRWVPNPPPGKRCKRNVMRRSKSGVMRLTRMKNITCRTTTRLYRRPTQAKARSSGST
jgi:hypothetical protein